MTDQSERIKLILEAVKSLVKEVNLHFTSSGMRIIGTDFSDIVMVVLDIDAELLRQIGGEYACETPCVVGLDTRIFSDCLKCTELGDVIKIKVDFAKHPHRLILKSTNPSRKKSTKWRLVTPECVREPMFVSVSQCGYFVSVNMDSGTFYEIIKKMVTTRSDSACFECDGHHLKVSANGLLSEAEFCIDAERISEGPSMQDENEQTGEGRGEAKNGIPACDGEATAPRNSGAKTHKGGGGRERPTGATKSDGNRGSKQGASKQQTSCASRVLATLQQTCSDPHWPVSGVFPILYLQNAAKAKSVSRRMSLHLKPAFPLALCFELQFGVLSFIISHHRGRDAAPDPGGPMSAEARDECGGLDPGSDAPVRKRWRRARGGEEARDGHSVSGRKRRRTGTRVPLEEEKDDGRESESGGSGLCETLGRS